MLDVQGSPLRTKPDLKDDPLPDVSGGIWQYKILTQEQDSVICMKPTAHTALYLSYCDAYYIFQEAMNQGTSPFCLMIYPCTPVSPVACLTWNSEQDVLLYLSREHNLQLAGASDNAELPNVTSTLVNMAEHAFITVPHTRTYNISSSLLRTDYFCLKIQDMHSRNCTTGSINFHTAVLTMLCAPAIWR
jgi:hypothetical protein